MSSFPCPLRKQASIVYRLLILAVLTVLFSSVALCQSTALVLSSGSGSPGATVALNLSLSNTAAGGQPANLQFTLNYNSNDFSAMDVSVGPVASAAGKSVVCNATSTATTCLVWGMNGTTLGDGVIAVVNATLSTTSSNTDRPIGITGALASTLEGYSMPLSATGSTVQAVLPPPAPSASSLVCSPATLAPGASTTCTATLTQVAPTGGTAVSISSSTTALTVPASITVSAGATSKTFQAIAGSVSNSTSAVVTASAGGVSKTTTVTIAPLPQLTALNCSPTSVNAPGTSSCSVVLTLAAPSGGITVTLASNNSNVTVPASVSIAAGQTAASFTANVGQITTDATAQLSATYAGVSRTATLSLVSPAVLSSVACSPSTISPGGSTTCTVAVTKAAPSGGFVASLSSSNSAALALPTSVTVSAGSTSVTFQATAGSVATSTSVVVTASAGGASKTTTVTITPLSQLTALNCSPTSVNAPGTSSCSVALTLAAPSSGITVTLASNNSNVTVPASVSIAAGQTAASFTANVGQITADATAQLSATYAGVSRTATLSLVSPAVLSSVACSPSTISPGGSTTCTVAVTKAAPSGGFVASLSSSNSAALALPASVTVSAGSTSVTFQATAGSVATSTSVVVTASASGASKTTTVTIAPLSQLTALNCSPTSVNAPGTSACSVVLTLAAPSGGITVTLASNDSNVTVPASVSIAAGQTAASFTANVGQITADATASLSATYGGVTRTATLSLVAPVVLSSVACSPSTISAGGSTTCTIALTKTAPSEGHPVALSSSNPTALSVPASITVLGGTTSSTFQADAGSVALSEPVTITATGSPAVSTVVIVQCTDSQPAGLVAAYSFNEGSGAAVSDVSGNSADGTVVDATWTDGKYGKALSFNGASSYVDLGKPASLQLTGSMTWSAWVYAAANPPDDGQIIAKSDNTNGWQFKSSPDTGAHTFGVAVSENGTTHTQRYSKTVRSLNTWYYVAGVYDASARTLDIYVNGALDNGTLRGVVPSSQSNLDTNVTIGKRAGGFYFNGVIDEVRVYNRALSEAEIQADMNTPIGSSTPPSPPSSPAVSSLVCSPVSLSAGASATCTAALTQAAPTGGTVVAVSSDNPALTVPASGTVPAGATSMTFQATAGSVTASASAVVTATAGGTSKTATVTVDSLPLLSSLSCSPTAVNAPGASSCSVVFTMAAPNGGLAVTLASDNAKVTVPASVSVATGQTTASFTANVAQISINATAKLSATHAGVSRTATLSLVAPAVLSTVACSPSTISAGGTASCTVALTKAAPSGGYVVSVTSSKPDALSVPASVTVPNGVVSAVFQATAGSVASSQPVTITVAGSTALTTTVTVEPSAQLSALSCSPTTITTPGTSTCSVSLTSPAPSGGLALALSDNSQSLSAPSTVSVPAGATSASFEANASAVTSQTSAQITAAYNGISKSVTLTLQPDSVSLSALSCTPTGVPAGQSTTCQIELSSAAVTDTLVRVSDSSRYLSVPSRVTVRAGQSAVSFLATTKSSSKPTSVTITAKLSGITVNTTVQILKATASALTVEAPAAQTSVDGETVEFVVSAQDPADLPVTLTTEELPAEPVLMASGGYSPGFRAACPSAPIRSPSGRPTSLDNRQPPRWQWM